jgi:phosphoribosylformylglycinamidine cyclo-ligase
VESRLSDLDQPLGEVLLTPTRIYAKQILTLAAEYPVKGIAHITGGGLTENVPRILPSGCVARLHRGSWPAPPIFSLLKKIGRIDVEEMHRVFNMGIGLVLVTSASQADGLIARAAELGDKGFKIGEIIAGGTGEPRVEYVETDEP